MSRSGADADLPADPSTSEDAAALVVASRAAAELAFRFAERLRLFALRRLRDASAAEDVAQETLRRVTDALYARRIEHPEAIPAFVFQTARHVCLEHQRAAGRESRALLRLGAGASEASLAPDALAQIIREERRVAVRQALAGLDESDRHLLRLAYYEQLDAPDIARRLGTTPGALRVRKHRALRRLAALLHEADARNESPPSAT